MFDRPVSQHVNKLRDLQYLALFLQLDNGIVHPQDACRRQTEQQHKAGTANVGQIRGDAEKYRQGNPTQTTEHTNHTAY